MGTAAEWCVVPEDQAVPIPDGVSSELAASLGVPALTAHRCLFADGPLRGCSVWSRAAPAPSGTSPSSWPSGPARGRRDRQRPGQGRAGRPAGADVVVNYRDADAADQLASFAPADRIVEVALGANMALALALSGPQTTIVTYAAEATDPVLPVRAAMTANVSMRFVLLYGVPRAMLRRAATDITQALADGALTELPVTEFSLGEVAAAHDAVQAGAVGKVLVVP